MGESEVVTVGGGEEAQREQRPGRPRAALHGRSSRGEDFVSELVRRESAAMLRVAGRYSYCPDDAAEAYGRALEILLRRAHDLDPERAGGYLARVVKHEALAVRRERQRERAADTAAMDREEARHLPGPDEHAAGFELVARSAEALRALKPQEVTALWLRMQGLSYEEIGRRQEWSHTKVNRCISEGRRAFLARFAGIEAGEECRRWEPVLSALADGEASSRQLSDVRAHLRHCAGCRRRLEAIHAARGPLEVVFPVALAAGGAGEQGEAASGLLVRAYEALAGLLQERAAASAIKVQAAVEATGAAKVTAVAASTAALAGGGAVAVDTVQLPVTAGERVEAIERGDPGPKRRAAARELLAGDQSLATLPRTVPGVASGRDPLVVRAKGRRAKGRRAEGRRAATAPSSRPASSSAPRREFAGEFTGAAQPAPAPARSAAAGGATEFGSSAPAVRTSTGGGSPGVGDSSPRPPSSVTETGGGEFGGGEFGP